MAKQSKLTKRQVSERVEQLTAKVTRLGYSAQVRNRDGKIYLYTDLVIDNNSKFRNYAQRLFPNWYVTQRSTGESGYGINYRLV